MVIEISTISRVYMDNGRQSLTLEEAMTLTGYGKFNLLGLAFCAMMLTGTIMETLGFSFIIPAAQCDLDLTLTQKSWLAAIPFIGIILTSHTWGYLADTRGRRWTLLVSMSLGCFFSILSSLSPNLIVFAIIRLVASLFVSGPSALGYAYLGEITPLKHRDKMLTLGTAFSAFGVTVIPLIAWGVLPYARISWDLGFLVYRPWRLLLCLYALPFLFCSFIISRFPESPKFLAAQGREEEALNVLRWMFKLNTGKPENGFPVNQLVQPQNQTQKKSFLNEVWDQTVPLFGSKYGKNILYTFFLQFGVFGTSNGFYIWIPTIINRMYIFNEHSVNEGANICHMFNYNSTTLSAQIIMDTSKNITAADPRRGECDDSLHTEAFTMSIAASAFMFVSTVACAYLLRWTGKRNLMVFIFAIVGLGGFIAHWASSQPVVILIFAFFVVAGTCVGLVTGYIVEIIPTNLRGMAVCLSLMAGRVGSITATHLIGYLLVASCSLTFFIFAALMFICLGICFLLPKERKRNSKEKPKHENSINSHL